LSAFLLSKELTPLLENANHSRIVNVGGEPPQILQPTLDFCDLNSKQNYNGIDVATNTVHAKVVMTEILAKKLKGQKIDVNAFYPGAVKSNLGRNMNFPLIFMFKIAGPFLAKESQSGIYLSTSQEVTGVTGQLFVKEKLTPLNFEKEYKDRLWNMTEEIVEKVLS
jgi:NAD(P)-dependent dehydrogenase (short-subunit alcohol dehydrogenase family)